MAGTQGTSCSSKSIQSLLKLLRKRAASTFRYQKRTPLWMSKRRKASSVYF
ncbi:hypothetical protein RSAG8_08529, partial [Rhizoctonia solani AG-8 WAC10335]